MRELAHCQTCLSAWFFAALVLLGGSISPRFSRAIEMPSVDELPLVEELPNPFLMQDGTLVSTPQQWVARREEMKKLILYYEYGSMPPAPKNVTAQEESEQKFDATGTVEKRLTILCGPGNQVRFRARLLVPSGRGPFPVLLKNVHAIGHIPITETLLRHGYLVAEYAREDLAPDRRDVLGSAQAAYPEYDWGTIAVWAWGTMRFIDYLVTLEVVDAEQIAVTGHSRGGKVAMLAGALDERIALTAPNGSGAGGGASYRVQGHGSETLTLLTEKERFAYWFHPRLRSFSGHENRLPFDQHFLKALVAPRALLTTDAKEDRWANPSGTQQTFLAAQPVFDFLGAKEKNGIALRDGQHDQTVEDWETLLEFAELQFRGKVSATPRDFQKLPFPDLKPAFRWGIP